MTLQNAPQRALATAGLALLLALPLHAAAENDPECGDVDANGVIDSFDALLIQRHVTQLITLSPRQLGRSDVSGDGEITFFDVITLLQFIGGSPGVTLHCPPLQATKLVGASFYPNAVLFMDRGSFATTRALPVDGDVISIAGDPARDRAYVGLYDGRVLEVDTENETLLGEHVLGGLIGELEVTRDGTTLVGVWGGIGGIGVVVIDLPAFTVRHTLPLTGAIFGPGFLRTTPDSRHAWFSDTVANRVVQVDLQTGSITRVVSTDIYPMGIDLSPAGTEVWVANNAGHNVSRINALTGTETARELSAVLPGGLVVQPSGDVYVTGGFYPEVARHDRGTGVQVESFAVDAPGYLLHRLADGDMAVVTWTTFTLPIVDPQSGEVQVVPLEGALVDVTSVAKRRLVQPVAPAPGSPAPARSAQWGSGARQPAPAQRRP